MEYTVKIDSFDGPLDLLLHLLKKDNINIWDVEIDKITKQYLDYIHKMENLNLTVASEYLVMASDLIEMKSRSLLPNMKNDEEIEEDPRDELIRKLLDYNKYKEVCKAFKDLEENRKEIFTKEPSICSEFINNEEIEEEITINDLLDAFKNFLEKKEIEKPLQTKITKKEYSVHKRNLEIKKLLKNKKEVTFYELFEEYNKDYVVVTFLSILDLSKKREIFIKQTDNFKEIYLTDRND
jgi:Uncharacterized conserved protein